MKYNQFKNDLIKSIENGNDQAKIATFISDILKQEPSKSFSYRKASFSVLKNTNKSLAIEIIEPAIPQLDNKFLNAVKERTYDLIKSGLDEKRTVLKKVLLRELEIEFHKTIKEEGEAVALSILSKKLEIHPYLSQTITRRLSRHYNNKNNELHEKLKERLQQ